MRTIKFRIWDEDNKVFNYFDFTDLEKLRWCLDGFEDYFSSKYLNDNPEYLQQFTGLVDKNGKEIYEGDIYMTEKGNKYFVYFVNGAFCGGVKENNVAPLGFEEDEIDDIFVKQIEVIGNIHEK